MRRVLVFLMVVALCAFAFSLPPIQGQGRNAPPAAQATAPQSKGGKFRRTERAIPNQYIVVFNNDVGDVRSLANRLARAHQGTILYVYEHSIKGFAVRLPEAAALALSQNPQVAYVEEDGEVRIVGTQPRATPGLEGPVSWGLDRIDQNYLPLNGVYNYNRVGSGVHAYIIDTGVRPSHQEFGSRANAVFDAFGGNGIDCHNHGTHVAGTTGGRVYGVAKNVMLYGVRVLDCGGSGSWASVIAGVDWVTYYHIKPAVANMSLGGWANDAVDDAVRQSISAGVTYVIAAGNSNDNAAFYSPARVGEAITVGATDSSDTRAWFSNYGWVLDVFAPGVLIPSAVASSDTAIDWFSGTSMAAPHVAGVVAQYLEAYPWATPADAHWAITAHATYGVVYDPGPWSPNLLLYAGFVPPPAVNPIDHDQQFFVRQHYNDFLKRHPDQAGWNFWTGEITQCGSDPACIDRKRIDVSRAFWFATEFWNRPDVQASGLVVNPNSNHPFDNRQFVRWCYLTYLQREPDQAGWDFWTSELERDLANDPGQGGYNHLIHAFLLSIEYKQRFQ